MRGGKKAVSRDHENWGDHPTHGGPSTGGTAGKGLRGSPVHNGRSKGGKEWGRNIDPKCRSLRGLRHIVKRAAIAGPRRGYALDILSFAASFHDVQEKKQIEEKELREVEKLGDQQKRFRTM